MTSTDPVDHTILVAILPPGCEFTLPKGTDFALGGMAPIGEMLADPAAASILEGEITKHGKRLIEYIQRRASS